jgi:hypothetical protein
VQKFGDGAVRLLNITRILAIKPDGAFGVRLATDLSKAGQLLDSGFPV